MKTKRNKYKQLTMNFSDLDLYQKIGDWIPSKQAMLFLNYGATKFAQLVKSGCLETAKIGRRRFVKVSSIEALLNAAIE
jgi:hypothetical protein